VRPTSPATMIAREVQHPPGQGVHVGRGGEVGVQLVARAGHERHLADEADVHLMTVGVGSGTDERRADDLARGRAVDGPAAGVRYRLGQLDVASRGSVEARSGRPTVLAPEPFAMSVVSWNVSYPMQGAVALNGDLAASAGALDAPVSGVARRTTAKIPNPDNPPSHARCGAIARGVAARGTKRWRAGRRSA
jgi:hypothetical protein